MKKLSALVLILLISATQAHTFKCSTCGKKFSAVEIKAKSEFAETMQDLGKSIGDAGKDLGNFFSATTLTFINKTKDAGLTMKDGIVTGYTNTKDGIKSAATKTKDGFVNGPKNIKDGIVTGYIKTKDGIKNAAIKTKDGFVGVIQAPKKMTDGIVNASKNTKEFIQNKMAESGEFIAVSVKKTGEVIKTSGETLEKNSKNFRPESYIEEPAEEVNQEEESN